MADRDGRIRYWNGGAERIFGHTAADVVGESLDIIIPPPLRDRHWRGYDQVMKSGETRYGDSLLKVPALRRDGSRISVEFNVALLRDCNGDPAGIFAYLRDVTASWKEYQELRSRLRDLQNENEKPTEEYMSEVSDRFSAIFREEHRAVRDALLDLIEAFRAQAPERARGLLQRIAELSGPHFRYEEEVMYPGLVQIFGQKYVDSLFREHDGAIRSAERLLELSQNEQWNEAEIDEATELVREILPHVSDCDGLSLMVERLPVSEVDAILEARDRSLADGVDLIRWAREIRASSGARPAAA